VSVKTAVIRVGSLGQYHTRILGRYPDSKLEFVVDADEKIVKVNKMDRLTDSGTLIGKIDAAIIAVPPSYH
jgi:hypothetical protein